MNILKKQLGVILAYVILVVLLASADCGAVNKALLFVGNDSYPPISYQEGGKPKGLAIDIVRALGERMGRQIDIRLMEWKVAQAMVAEGKADALCQLTITEPRKQIYDFSDQAHDLRFSIFVRTGKQGINDLTDLRGLQVAVWTASVQHQYAKADPQIKITLIANDLQGFQLLKDGKVDAVLADLWTGSYVLAEKGITGIQTSGEPFARLASALAVKKGNTALLAAINDGLRSLQADGTIERINKKWRPKEIIVRTREQVVRKNYYVIIGILALLLVVGAFWLITLKREIAERRTAEQALRESEKKYRNIFDHAIVGIFQTTPEGRYNNVNPAFASMAGYGSPDEMQSEITNIGEQLYVNPEDRKRLLTLIQASDGAVREFETQVRRKDGTLFWISINVRMVNNEAEKTTWLEGTCIDITDRKQAELSLRRLQLQRELILNSVGEGIYGMSPDGRMTFINPEATRLLGYKREDLVGQYIHPLIHHTRTNGTPYPPEECRALIAFKEGTARTVRDEVFWRKDGTRFPVEYTSTPMLGLDNLATGAVVVFRDITERDEIEKERIARIAAENANKAKSDFLTNMSHELRTPLNGIIGFADLLQDGIAGALNNDQKEYAGLIHHSGKHLLSLINDILDMAKVEAGKMELQLSHLRLISEIEYAVLMVKERALKHGIAITVDSQPELEIEADERKLRQILFNLLSNAVKFTPEGGSVCVTAQVASNNELNKHITPEEGRSGVIAVKYCEISVTDTGIGIKEEDISKLFREFSQIGDVHTKEYEGTGLGLALTRKLVELHGGSIWVKSKFGQGSTFTFTIPLRESSDLPVKNDPKEYGARSPFSESAETSLDILVAEDNVVNQELIKTLLTKRGHRIAIVQDGIEAIKVLRRNHFDLVFMDIQMSEQDGYKTTQLIRKTAGDTFDHHIPIIAMTAYAMRGDRDKCLLAGMNDYISKPIAVEELDRVLDRFKASKYNN